MVNRSTVDSTAGRTGGRHAAKDQRVVHLDPHTLQEIPPDEVAAFVARAQASWDD